MAQPHVVTYWPPLSIGRVGPPKRVAFANRKDALAFVMRLPARARVELDVVTG
jgi:hypothetical protein